ncbi:MAG TPA: PKD domain-containing protein, partial [Vicinamibacteria bacterium]|nr:PKD domain-containing protein [Vicinamibacteria bacterium]
MLARLTTAGWLLLSCVLARPATAQIAPRILHDGLGCIVAGQHAVIEALVEPTDDLITVKVYFRAEIYPAFFYVEAAPSGGSYQAVLPRPTRDVSAVVYYLEAVDRAFNSFRTEEFRPRVVRDPADCDEDSRQPAYVEGPDGITVGATAAGSRFPPGFLTEGIVGTITAAGRAAGGSSGTLIGIGAAAGAAAGVGILVGGDEETTTIPAAGGPTTTVPITTSALTTSVPATGVVACFDTTPNPPTIPVGETVRFDASCSQPADQIASYVWDFNDGRDGREGRVITRQYQSAGVFPAELTITDIRGVQARVEKEVRVNETSGGPGPGSGKVISISKGGPAAANVGVQFAYTITITNTGSSPASGITMTDAIPVSLRIDRVRFTVNADNCGRAANTVTCTAATLAPGASFTVTIDVTPVSAGSITNVANV